MSMGMNCRREFAVLPVSVPPRPLTTGCKRTFNGPVGIGDCEKAAVVEAVVRKTKAAKRMNFKTDSGRILVLRHN
jgi:hypothetical protein